VRREDVTPEILEREKEIARDQARQSGKPEAIIEKIATGKVDKFFEENCLYEQHFIKDESVTVNEMIIQTIAKMGEKVSVRRFVRMKVGDVSATYAPGSTVKRDESEPAAEPAKA
jgi:elongation factor Ts